MVRPTILLPRGITSALSSGQLRWVLLHELAHVRQHDLIVVASERVAVIIYFFNPVLWAANRIINQIREYACDDLAVALSQTSPVEAGAAFVEVLRHADRPRRGLDGALGIFWFDSRAACFHRVRRLLDTDRPIRTALGVPSRLALVLLAACWLPSVRVANQQTMPAPRDFPDGTEKPIDPPSRATEHVVAGAPFQDGQDFELTVVGPGGKPVAGAVVGFDVDPAPLADQVRRGEWVGKRRYLTDIQADAEGKLAVAFPKAPTRMSLKTTLPGYGAYSATWSESTLAARNPSRFTAELDEGWSVGGIIVDAEGKPVEGVQVHPGFESKKRPGELRQLRAGAYGVTDGSGRWRCDSVPAAMSEVFAEISHSAYQPIRRELTRAGFGIEPGREPASQIVLERGLTVRGTVTDDAGKPIVGAVVRTKYLNDVREAKTWSDGI